MVGRASASRRVIIGAIGAALVVLVGGVIVSQSSASSARSTAGLGIAVFSPFPRNDFSITQAAIEGAKAVMKAWPGSRLTIVDNVSDPQRQVQTLRVAAKANDIVILASGSLGQPADVVAAEYPKTKFLLYNTTTAKFHPNVTSVANQVGVGGIVTGAVMANQSSSKKLGFVTGLQIPGEVKELNGVKQGAKVVAPSATVASTFTGDYNDIGKAKSATQAQIDNGIDVILGDLGLGFTGFFQATKGAGVPAVIYSLYPDLGCGQSSNLIGGMVWNIRAQTQSLLTRLVAGKLKPGALFIGLKRSGIFGFQFCPGRGKASDRQVATSVRNRILSGNIVPSKSVLNYNPKYQITNE